VPVILTVALVGDPHAERRQQATEDLHTPYYDRPKVDVTVDETESFGDVLRQAAQELLPDGRFTEAFVDFHRDDGRPPTLRRELHLLDAEGRVRSTRQWMDEPVAEILRAGEAGVLGGDPRRPYLHNTPPMGNGILSDWPTFVEFLRVYWMLMGGLATVGGVWQFFKFVGEAMRTRGPESVPVVESLADAWDARGLRPDRLLDLLGDRPWHLTDLAERLGCSEREAEALLVGLGFAPRSDGLWIAADDEGSRMLRGDIDIIVHAGLTTQREAVEDEWRARAQELVETGHAPPVDWSRVREMPADHSRLPVVEEEPESLAEDVRFGLDQIGFGVGQIARGIGRHARQRLNERKQARDDD